MTAVSKAVLVTNAWPRGVCPLHMFEGGRCTGWCMSARIELAALQADYLKFWPTYQQVAA